MSQYFRVSPIEIEQQWSIDDVDHAHDALDYVEQLERIQMRKLRKSS